MKSRIGYKFGVLALIVIVTVLMTSCKTPPEKLKSTEVSSIHSVSVNDGETIELTSDELNFWKKINFLIVESEYPGETPDYVIDLIGEKNNFTAMYNENTDIVFFSFVPEIEYGLLNSPPPGGWTKPLYKTEASEKLLELLKIKNAPQQRLRKHAR